MSVSIATNIKMKTNIVVPLIFFSFCGLYFSQNLEDEEQAWFMAFVIGHSFPDSHLPETRGFMALHHRFQSTKIVQVEVFLAHGKYYMSSWKN